jgi:hypothetical protein
VTTHKFYKSEVESCGLLIEGSCIVSIDFRYDVNNPFLPPTRNDHNDKPTKLPPSTAARTYQSYHDDNGDDAKGLTAAVIALYVRRLPRRGTAGIQATACMCANSEGCCAM